MPRRAWPRSRGSSASTAAPCTCRRRSSDPRPPAERAAARAGLDGRGRGHAQSPSHPAAGRSSARGRPAFPTVGGHHSGDLAVPEDTGPVWRRDVLYRRTDLEVRRLVGKTPLSIAADKIAYPAIRWAAIAARLREQGAPTPLDGTGVACEVYPGAALAAWGFGAVRYKKAKGSQERGELVEALDARWPWLDWAGHQGLCATSDDALDAVIAAVVAREVLHGRAVSPPTELTAAAADEGWIWLPAQD
ncbi:DUF429 domain-containing protein [Brachybacterium sp. J153]|uniref:DUF429 domain-containing protein n=1 Tax=Brachybacterium sp. J153 TaxID=3116488 RepID=UPI002E790ADC|nr:DUF429 domain-containing protein [Brachybacterium sp. J153]MEE1619273.1 DUF429 domain-containing protein [Brachybacterium sp. J153]